MEIFLSQSKNPDKFLARNFMFVPVEPSSAAPPRHTVPLGGGLIILCGMAIIDFAGDLSDKGASQTFHLEVDEDFKQAIQLAPSRPGFLSAGFAIARGVVFATVNARSRPLRSDVIGGGVAGPAFSDETAVEQFFLETTDGAPGLAVTVRVRDNHSTIHALGYHVSLYGTLLGLPTPQ